MAGQEITTPGEKRLIEQRCGEIRGEVIRHVTTLSHGNGSGCNGEHSSLDGTIINLYYTQPMEVDHTEVSVASTTTERICVVAVTRRFAGKELETSNWRFMQDGNVIREGVLIKPSKTDRFAVRSVATTQTSQSLVDDSSDHNALPPTIKDLDILFGIVKNPDANIGDARLLSRLPGGSKGSGTNSPKPRGRSHL